MKSSNIIVAFSLVIGATLIAAGLVGASYVQSMNPQATKNAAVDGCMLVAKGIDTSGSIEQNGWSVQKSNMNAEMYSDCMKKKGY